MNTATRLWRGARNWLLSIATAEVGTLFLNRSPRGFARAAASETSPPAWCAKWIARCKAENEPSSPCRCPSLHARQSGHDLIWQGACCYSLRRNPNPSRSTSRLNGEQAKVLPSSSNVGTFLLPLLSRMTCWAASGFSSMLISSYSMFHSFKNRLAMRQSEHQGVV